MILLTLSAEEAQHIASKIDDAAVIDRICAQLRFDEVFEGQPDEPKTILFRDEGAGLRVAAISYQHEAAAEAAFNRFWDNVLAEWKRAPLFADQGVA